MKIRTQAALMALLLVFAVPVFAQEPPPGPPGPPGRRGEWADSMRPRMLSVESALRLKQQLKLSDAQVNQLEAVRKEIVAERQARATEMIETHSKIAAGLLSREDVRKNFDSKRDALRQTIEQRRDRIAKILTAEQQQQLQQETRRYMMDRMHDRRGRFGPPARGLRRMGPRGMPSWRDF